MSDDNSTMESNHEVPDPTEEPLKAAFWMLQNVRDDMSGELYDEHEEVRDWAMNIEWAYSAVAEHEDFEYDR